MDTEQNVRDLGYANGWHDDSLERRLVEMTKKAGYHFQEEFISPHIIKYTCKEAGLIYYTNYSEPCVKDS